MPMAANRDALLRDLGITDGVLPTWVFPGGYPVYYLVSDEWDRWDTCCAECANGPDATEKDKKGRFTGTISAIGCDINWEDDDMACSVCGVVIPSAYEDPDDGDGDEYDPENGDVATDDYRRFYQHGKLVVTVPDGESWQNRLREWMEGERFFPNAYFISDHGNAALILD